MIPPRVLWHSLVHFVTVIAHGTIGRVPRLWPSTAAQITCGHCHAGWMGGAIRPFEEDVPHFLAGKEPQVL